MALYPKKQEPLRDELFSNPTSEYRGAPFWAWNCQMTPEKVTMIVEALRDMGMGGGHIHCRTGMNNPYMGEEFLGLVKDANKKFTERDMLTWLYDEDRWPSGAGGGLVTKEEAYRIRFLVFTPESLEGKAIEQSHSSSGAAVRSENRRLLARYQVCLEDGWLKDYKVLEDGETAGDGYTEWFAYLEISGDNPWFNNQSYVNTLDKKAIDRFIEVTHEAYRKELGEEFDGSIPAIFTDEPQFCHKTRLNYAADRMDVIIPYTDDLEETFQEAYGHSLLASLPELFWERKEEMVSQIRYEYHDHICERFATAFADNIGKWCKENNIMLTGHMMEEPTLKSQTAALGEAMRSYRSFQLPGIDMLCDRRELSTAKQAESASHQYGCPGVLSELYGVTNWDFDFRGHKLQGDWQAALGVTVRVPHLTWTSMAGEAKRDYPASIGYQSPWYKEYKYVEDYFARINTLLTRGKADVRIGVIHPIESYWLYWGSEEKTGSIREEMERNFDNLVKWLLYGLLDFDFISESLLLDQNDPESLTKEGFKVGEMNYQVILVPNCVTLRKSTLDRLKVWQSMGGKVIFAGDIPGYVDALPSKEAAEFAEKCICIPFTRNKVTEALKEERTVEVRDEAGLMAENLIYQMRKDRDNRIFFLAHVEKMKNPDLPKKEGLTISLKGTYRVICYEPLNGTKKELAAEYKNGKTILKRTMYDHDSLLLYLIPTEEICEDIQASVPLSISENCMKAINDWDDGADISPSELEICADAKEPLSANCRNIAESSRENRKELQVDHVVPVTLSEPNVLVLDQAEYAFDKGAWMPREELLRIDNKFREILQYPLRMEAFAQPWLDQTVEKPEHTLSLRFHIESETEIADTQLALENTEAAVTLNGEPISMEETGWYTDKEIICRKLGHIRKGTNELLVEIPYSRKENIENLFLLGEFGVKVCGAECVLTEPVRTLAFGDYTVQGLPFYGGNVEYHVPITVSEDCIIRVEASRFRNPLLKASIDDGEAKVIAFAPYEVKIDCMKGEHILNLTAFGNRINTFGTLHNCNETETWYGPNAWRTEGREWAYEYQLKPTGILKTPVVEYGNK